MSVMRIVGIGLLALVWCWLVRAILVSGGGFTPKNIFIIVASGIIIFVPIWKKYFRNKQS